MSVVYKAAVGNPFTVTVTGVDLDLDGFAEGRPVILQPIILGRTINDPNSSVNRLPIAAFRAPTLADFQSGNNILGRNTFYRDGVNNTDLSFYKSFVLPFEGHKIVVRADLFNAFNQVRYGLPNTLISTPATFGRITTESNDYLPRNIQVSLRYVF